MRVAVTGGSGQLGTALVRRLVADRSIEKVLVLDLRPPIVASRKVEFVRADVREGGFARYLEGVGALFHFAFVVTQAAPPDVLRAVNVEGSANVFRAAAAAGVGSLIYASSVAAYGVVPGHPEPIVEDTPRRRQPELPYAAAKYDVEAILDELEPACPEMAIARLRPVILAGRRMEHGLGRALRAGVLPDVQGEHPIPLVWDEDVAQAAVLAMKQRARGAFCLDAEDPLTGPQLAEAAGLRRVSLPRKALAGAAWLAGRIGLSPREDPSWLAIEPATMRVSARRAREELGWKPRYPTGRDVAKALGDAARGAPDPRIAMFLRLSALAFAREAPRFSDAQRLKADVHLELTGRGGRDYTLAFDCGRLKVSAGVPRPPTSVVTLPARALLDLLAGRTATATVQLTGRVRVEGEPLGIMALNALVHGFRTKASSSDPKDWPARRLARWFGDPGPTPRSDTVEPR
jgi:nucleoside-diphosphate-sugar epimerase/putative sterol carrier protein